MSTNTAHLQTRRTAHHQALASLHAKPATGTEHQAKLGLKMWRALRKLEVKTSDAATAQCNGCRYADQNYRSDAEWSRFKMGIKERVAAIFGGTLPKGFFINGDPRGASLKIDPERGSVPKGMQTYWGGYGILAAEIND